MGKKKYAALLDKKAKKQPITMVTAYDYPTAKMVDAVGIDVVLIGDSVGTNVLGYVSEQEVTMADMLHHCKAVARGTVAATILVDLPFGSAPDSVTAAENGQLLLDAGADMVKIEGWGDKKNIVAYLSKRGIPVCGHIGYNPQIHGPKGRLFGKDAAGAAELIASARLLIDAGAVMLVVEKVPEEITGIIAAETIVPVIGIGSGRICDGQVLVVHDVLGMTDRQFAHAQVFGQIKRETMQALTAYKDAVEQHRFPGQEQVAHSDGSVVAAAKQLVGVRQ